MTRKIHDLSDHIIICGYGRMGQVICQEMTHLNEKFVIIENGPKATEKLIETKYMWIEGDATSDKTLIDAGIARAKTLVSMVDNDSDSLYISLAGRSLNDKLYIISRASDPAAKLKILRAGADKVILPILVSSLKAAQTIVTPEVDDLLDIEGVNLSKDKRVQVAEIPVNQDSRFHQKSLRESGPILEKALVIGIRHIDESFTFVPNADYKIKSGDTLVTLSTAETFNQIKDTHDS